MVGVDLRHLGMWCTRRSARSRSHRLESLLEELHLLQSREAAASAAAAATVGLCIGPLAFDARSRLGGRDRGGWRQTTRGDGSSESSRVHRAAVEVAAEVPLALELSLAEEATPVFTAPHGHWMARGKVCCDCLMREERRRREPRGSHCDAEMEVSSHANLEVVQLTYDCKYKRGHRELQVRSLTPSIHITHGIDQASET